jgi:hypothetical protein
MPRRVLSSFGRVEFQDLRVIGMTGDHGMGGSGFAESTGEVDLFCVCEELLPQDDEEVFFEERGEGRCIENVSDAGSDKLDSE